MLSAGLLIRLHSLCHQVVFKKAVSLKEHPKVNEWLTCVETEMRTTLATLLATAVTEIQQFNSESIDGQKYMHWVDGYQVKKEISCVRIGLIKCCLLDTKFDRFRLAGSTCGTSLPDCLVRKL